MASACSDGRASSGYKDLLKSHKKHKKLNRRGKVENARERVVGKLGEDKIAEILDAFLMAQGGDNTASASAETQRKNKERADGVILTLLAQGLSQIEVISIQY